MVIAIVEPVFAGVLVSLLNKYVLSGQCWGWLQRSCEEVIEEEEGPEEEGISSTTTTVSDASVHVHCH
jgi:hypothetical protein